MRMELDGKSLVEDWEFDDHDHDKEIMSAAEHRIQDFLGSRNHEIKEIHLCREFRAYRPLSQDASMVKKVSSDLLRGPLAASKK